MSGTKKFDPMALVPSFAHYEDKCDGRPEVRSEAKVPIGLSGLGRLILSRVPMVICKKCGASYLPEGFEHSVERAFAKWLLKRPRLLSKPEVRFLRVTVGMTQAEAAEALDTERSYISKCESEAHGNAMGFDKQLRFRLVCAKRLSSGPDEFRELADVLASLRDKDELPEHGSGLRAPPEVEREALRRFG